MTDHPGPSVTDDSVPPVISAATSARTIDDYLLVAQLGDDSVGSVHRALHTGDGRFVRLRVLQSPELSARAMISTVRRELARGPEPIERHRGLRISDGVPYLVWPETGGWTLDTVLARFRAGGW